MLRIFPYISQNIAQQKKIFPCLSLRDIIHLGFSRSNTLQYPQWSLCALLSLSTPNLLWIFCILFHSFCFFLFRFSLSQHLFKPLAENLSTLKSYPWGTNCVTLVVKIHLPKVALSYSSVDLCTPCCVHFYKAILCRGDTAMSGVDTVQLGHLTPLGRLPGSGLRCRR